MGRPQRPLSPHLEIYRFSLTMALSILHRITGVGLYFGTVLLAWWLIAAAFDQARLDLVYLVMGSWPGQLVMLGFVWALFQHMLGGIKHFIWDVGAALEPDQRRAISWFTIIGALVMTALTWALFVLV